jgi:hypothetical protein
MQATNISHAIRMRSFPEDVLLGTSPPSPCSTCIHSHLHPAEQASETSFEDLSFTLDFAHGNVLDNITSNSSLTTDADASQHVRQYSDVHDVRLAAPAPGV